MALSSELATRGTHVALVDVDEGRVTVVKAARLILRAIEKKRFKLVFCVGSRLLNFLTRLAPAGTLALLRLANRSSATSD